MANNKIVAAFVATIAASLCCVTPVLAVLAGTSSLATSFSWMEPYHNYLVGLTVLVLIYAWWDKLKSKSKDMECACDETSGFFSSKKFLAIVTLFAIVMLTFPQWGYGYFKTEEGCKTCVVEEKEATPVFETKKLVIEKKKPVIENHTEAKNELPVFQYMREEKANPTACNQKACAGTGRIEVDTLMNKAKADVEEMSPVVLKKMIDNEDDFILLDVREAEQRAEGAIYADESMMVTRGNLEFDIMNKIKNKDAVIVTYCRSGGRGLFAAQTLKHLGYQNTYNLQGGLKGWARAGFPFDTGLGVVVKVTEE